MIRLDNNSIKTLKKRFKKDKGIPKEYKDLYTLLRQNRILLEQLWLTNTDVPKNYQNQNGKLKLWDKSFSLSIGNIKMSRNGRNNIGEILFHVNAIKKGNLFLLEINSSMFYAVYRIFEHEEEYNRKDPFSNISRIGHSVSIHSIITDQDFSEIVITTLTIIEAIVSDQIKLKVFKEHNADIIPAPNFNNYHTQPAMEFSIDEHFFTDIIVDRTIGVHGHFRNQRVGKGRKQIKRIWIDHFNKNGYRRKAKKRYLNSIVDLH